MRKLVFGRYDYAAFISYFAYAAGSIVVPVALVEIARDMSFALDEGGMGQAGLLHMGRTAAMVGAMALCGFVSARFGMRRTLGWSVALMSVGVGLCGVSPTYGLLFAALAIAGVGEGVVEGLATPFVAALHPKEPGRYINFSHAFWSVGVFVAVIATGLLIGAGVAWRWPIVVTAGVSLLAAVLILLPARPEQAYPEHPEPAHPGRVLRQAWGLARTPRFWLYFAAMFVAGGGEFCLTFWTAAYIQLTFIDAAMAGGIGTACFAAGMFVGRTGAGVLVPQHRLRRLILAAALLGAVTTLVLPWCTSFAVLLVLLFVSGLATAPFWPSVQGLATDRLPGHDATILLILLSCAGVPGCGVFTWLLGVVADHTQDLRLAFCLVPACFVTLGLLIALDRKPLHAEPATNP